MNIRRLRVLALFGVLAIASAACADDNTTSAGAAPVGSDAATSSSSAAPAVSNDFALEYTGGTAGKADASKSPITIGYVNQEGGVPAFPEATSGVEAAVEYVNEELGGAGGHPIEIKKCVVQAEEDGQKCATEMLNDDKVTFVTTGVLTVGNDALYKTLSGKKPVFIGFPGAIPDFIAEDAYAFTPGATGVLKGMALFIGQQLQNVKKVAVVHSDNDAGKAGAETLLKPELAKLGITDVTLVPVSDAATAPDLAAAVQAAGVDTADVFVPLVTVQGCAATFDALTSLALTPTVVATGICYGAPMTKHMQDLGSSDQVPDGWYFAGTGYSYFLPDDASGMATYLAKMKQYGPSDVDFTGFAGSTFANVLTSVKFINQVGPDAVTADGIRQAAKSFTGPMMLIAGPVKCGFSPVFKTICGTQMGVEQYKDGTWLPVADALNNKAIDVSAP